MMPLVITVVTLIAVVATVNLFLDKIINRILGGGN
jgi:hypothetical protein